MTESTPTKKVRLNYAALTRMEYSEIAEVPAHFDENDIEALMASRSDDLDGSGYIEDNEYWEETPGTFDAQGIEDLPPSIKVEADLSYTKIGQVDQAEQQKIKFSVPTLGPAGEGRIEVDDLESLVQQAKALESLIEIAQQHGVSEMIAAPKADAMGFMEGFSSEVDMQVGKGTMQLICGLGDTDFAGHSDVFLVAHLEKALERAKDRNKQDVQVEGVCLQGGGIIAWINEHSPSSSSNDPTL